MPFKPTASYWTTDGENFWQKIIFSSVFPSTVPPSCTISTAWIKAAGLLSTASCAGLRFLKKHRVEFNVLTVVNRQNSQHPLRVYRFLKGIGAQFMQFIPIVERMAGEANPDGLVLIGPRDPHTAQVSDWSVESRQYGVFLCEIFDEWVRKDVGKHFVQLFDVTLESWMGMEPSLCVFRPTCGGAMALEHNGDLYSCDHYVYPENKLGNILEQPLQRAGRFRPATRLWPR